MEVEYSLSLKDVHAFTFNTAQRSAKLSKVWGISQWIFMAFVLTWAASHFVGDTQLRLLLSHAVLLLVGAWTGVILTAWRYLRIIRGSDENHFRDPRIRFLMGPRRLSIAAEGITNISEGFRSYLPWKGIVDFSVSDDHVFFYNGSINAYLVPKRACRDEQHFQEFAALAQQYQQSRGPQAPKSTGIIAALPPQSDAFTRPDGP
ncbi:MAG: YcxB family protein [Gemmataceae bacterium]